MCIVSVPPENQHRLYRSVLFDAHSIALECFHLSYKGTSELVERAFCAIPLRNARRLREPLCEPHRRHMDRYHLSRKQYLDLTSRLDGFHDRNHEVEVRLVSFSAMRGRIGKLPQNSSNKMHIVRV